MSFNRRGALENPLPNDPICHFLWVVKLKALDWPLYSILAYFGPSAFHFDAAGNVTACSGGQATKRRKSKKNAKCKGRI